MSEISVEDVTELSLGPVNAMLEVEHSEPVDSAEVLRKASEK